MHLFGIDWVGVNVENARRLLLSLMFIAVVLVCSALLRALVGLILGRRDEASVQTKFWTRQGISLLMAVVLILGLLSIWFNDPTRLATGFGLAMGGVRGDVLRLGFIQTTIMEMGQPPSVQTTDPAMWVKSRQFTGRIVTVSNFQIFSERCSIIYAIFPLFGRKWPASASRRRHATLLVYLRSHSGRFGTPNQ